MSGYLWYFPLEDGVAHVGAGDLHRGHVKAVEGFFERYGGKKQKLVGRAVRLCPPKYCQPFQSGKVVGVGESIGTVFPLLGEGMIPTLECSELLVRHLDDLDEYRRQVLKKFAFYETCYDFLMPVFRGEMSMSEQASLSAAVFSHMWENQARHGVGIDPDEHEHRPQGALPTDHVDRPKDNAVARRIDPSVRDLSFLLRADESFAAVGLLPAVDGEEYREHKAQDS